MVVHKPMGDVTLAMSIFLYNLWLCLQTSWGGALFFWILFQKYSWTFLISYFSPLPYLPHLLSCLPSLDWLPSASLLSPAVLSVGIITHTPTIISLNHQLIFPLATLLRLQLLFTILQISFCDLPCRYRSHSCFGCSHLLHAHYCLCVSLCLSDSG